MYSTKSIYIYIFYGGIIPINFIYLINLKKKYICKIIILKIKNYNKNSNCKKLQITL